MALEADVTSANEAARSGAAALLDAGEAAQSDDAVSASQQAVSADAVSASQQAVSASKPNKRKSPEEAVAEVLKAMDSRKVRQKAAKETAATAANPPKAQTAEETAGR